MSTQKTSEEKKREESREKEIAAVSYLWIFSIPILIAKRDSHFIQHHARRGFVLFIVSIALWLVPPLRYGEFLILILMIFGFISAVLGNENSTPLLSEMADGTLRIHHLKYYWHHTKHGAIKVIKPDHITPEFRHELTVQHKELSEQEKRLEQEKKLVEAEDKKLSALYHRIDEDEKRIDELADEVHQLEIETEKLIK